ncbi:serine hydrolase [uncultured Brevibacillus sp.]|uniref:serine hydrolase domain-containing protein n=1 Tax=uncultured Brevibacillus sp. TaxID=169970 RepID=UPI00259A5D73|nr:serine hydrolase domain-containing protein [uncultured Brevibacillus sp.]
MQTKEQTELFEDYVQKVMKENQIPGVAVGLAKDGQLFFGKGFGYRDVEKQLEVTIDTVFAIGSITKSFTCVAIMQLQEAGKISVHDPVKKYLPNFRLKNGSTEPITIHHFMTHTSGIPALPSSPALLFHTATDEEFRNDPQLLQMNREEIKPVETYEEYLDYIAQMDFELLGPPGTQWLYNNDCYGLLGAIVERASGQSYEEYVKEHILQPAGMYNSSFFLDDLGVNDNITSLYVTREKSGKQIVIPSPNWWDSTVQRAAGFLKSSVRDMLNYTEIFRTGGLVGNNRILTSESVGLMTNSYFECNPIAGENYGYGLLVIPEYHGTGMVGHAGGMKGGESQMHIIAEKGLTGIVMSNLFVKVSTAIMNAAFNCLENRSPEATHIIFKDYPVSSENLAQFIGEFQEAAKILSLSVRLEEGQLHLYMNNQPTALKPIDEDLFLIEGSTNAVRFIRDENNEICKIDLGGFHFSKVQEAAKS